MNSRVTRKAAALSARRLELALARERLLERSADVRERVAVNPAALLPALALGDRVRDVAYWLRTHPALAVSAFVVVVVVRPRTVWRWNARGLGGMAVCSGLAKSPQCIIRWPLIETFPRAIFVAGS